MRVFVTGASGWIGSAVVPELRAAGHDVVGLARSDASAEAIAAAGAEVLRGDLDDLDTLRKGAASSDAVVHLAFIHDFDDFAACVRADKLAIDAFGEVLDGSGRPFLIASGVAAVPAGPLRTERDPFDPGFPRAAAAEATLAMVGRGVRSCVVRFAPTVHGDGDHGFVARLVTIARDRGVSGYSGEGANRWPAVHRSDAGRLVRLALDRAPAGSIVHAVAEEGVPIRTIAEVIGRHLRVPVVAVPPERAAGHFGWLGGFLSMDAPSSNALTRELLGWEPTGPGLVEDLEQGHYFDVPEGADLPA
jgi:nucleoside-diphosphate-sugar epimerase